MGLMALILGLILLEPDLAVAGVLALSLYAAHHALAKGGLFLGVGLRHQASRQGLVLAGILLLALSLAAVPFSGGAVAKYGIKPMLAATDWSWLVTAVAVSTVGTALLMARFTWVIWAIKPDPSPGQLPGGLAWAGLLALILLYAALLGKPSAWMTNAVPTLVALALALPFVLVARRRPNLLHPTADLVPAGDLLGLVRRPIGVFVLAGRSLGRWWSHLLQSGSARLSAAYEGFGSPPEDPERVLKRWPNAGAAWLAATALLLLLPLSTLPVLRSSATTDVAAETTETAPSGDARHTTAPKAETEPYETSGQEAATFDGQLASSRTTKSERPTASDVHPADPIFEEGSNARGAEESGGMGDRGPETARLEQTAAGISPPEPDPETPVTDSTIPSNDPDNDKTAPSLESALDDRSAEPTAQELVSVDQDIEPRYPEIEPEDPTPPPDQVNAESTSDTTTETLTCDPARTFVFSHPRAVEAVRLRDCIEGPDGHERAFAPTLTNALVELVQRHLTDLGYDPGPVDGLIGPRTRAAIRRFQRDEGIAATGVVTFELLERIGSAAATSNTGSGKGPAPE